MSRTHRNGGETTISFFKKEANRRVRRRMKNLHRAMIDDDEKTFGLSNYSGYKKYTGMSWEIFDRAWFTLPDEQWGHSKFNKQKMGSVTYADGGKIHDKGDEVILKIDEKTPFFYHGHLIPRDCQIIEDKKREVEYIYSPHCGRHFRSSKVLEDVVKNPAGMKKYPRGLKSKRVNRM